MVTLERQWHGSTGTSTINSNMFTMNNYGLVRITNLETGILLDKTKGSLPLPQSPVLSYPSTLKLCKIDTSEQERIFYCI